MSTKVDGYSSQRLAHVAAFGPVNLTLEDRARRNLSVVRSGGCADVEIKMDKSLKWSTGKCCECLFFSE